MEFKNTNIRYQFLIIILLIVIIILNFKTCSSGPGLKIAKSNQKYIENIANNKIDSLKKKIIQYQKARDIFDLKNLELEKSLEKLSIKNTDLQKSLISEVKKSKSFTRSEIANYFVDRYLLQREVKTTENGTELTDTIAKLNIEDLIIGDGAKKEVIILKNVLKIKDSTIFNDKRIIGITDFQSKSKDTMLIQKDTIIYSLKDLNKTFQKSLKKEKNKTFLWKITSGLIIFLSTLFILK